MDAEEEAQLTTPVSNLLSGVAAEAGLGTLRLIRETRLDRTRPDFAALLTQGATTRQKGFVELKPPSISVDVTQWTGRNARQWELLRKEAEILIVCNGAEAQLYRDGDPVGGAASLPYSDAHRWQPDALVRLLSRFFELTPTPIVDVAALSRRLAIRTADLRDRLLWLLNQSGGAGALAQGSLRAWRQHIYAQATERDFADGISQVVAYGMVLAVLTSADVDANHDGLITVTEARSAIRESSPVLAAAFAPLLDRAPLAEAVRVELGALETLISAVNARRVNASADLRGDPWLYFYEDFLSVYDPEERRQSGVYFTPIDIVQAMVTITDHLLVERLSRRLSFADPQVVTLDPAAGTGTFPLAVIDKAVTRAAAARGTAGPRQAAANLEQNLYAFELLPGPYSVAHLRLTQRLSSLSNGRVATARVILTDTLESPLATDDQYALFGDAETLAAEQNRARRIKLVQRVTVVIGNPPYRRVERAAEGRGSGGWVVSGRVPSRNNARSLFADIYDIANQNTIFSHIANLYNLYVYFWRWAIWKAFEAHGDGPGVVAFITGASWLAGPGFMGLRQLVREICDEAWVIDLGGDNRGANPEENVFAIETPVAVVVLARDGASNRRRPARVHYRRVRGTSEEKLQAMRAIAGADSPLAGEWTDAPTGWRDPFVPPTGDAAWTDLPLIADIFPWQQPGCKFGRTWPIAPSPDLLARRWEQFVGAPTEKKRELFVTASTGRNIDTSVGRLPKLSDALVGTPHQPIVRYAYRSFDRQWAFDDPRLAALERPALWQSLSERQIFFASLLTGHVADGPALTLAVEVPDLHFFRGNYGGKDIIPLYRDAACREANITAGLARVLAGHLGIEVPTPEDIAAYVYALLSASAYQARFADALRTPGLRVPLTADVALWREAVAAGSELIWLHSYAERFRDPNAGRGGEVPPVEGIAWVEPVNIVPIDVSAIRYDEATRTLLVGDGQVSGVRPDVWAYSVSGMPVVAKWLSYRTSRPTGRAASSASALDRVRPTDWADAWNDELLDLLRVLTMTLDRQQSLADLLRRICAAPLIPSCDLPAPHAAERRPPATLHGPAFNFAQ
ncbi:MAG TPA: type ISP restriction/modification enzyme [Acetobacteraceae bacterium]|nr:type ISP restriction/modification enzyme [Acetobacteraceae bacterium]